MTGLSPMPAACRFTFAVGANPYFLNTLSFPCSKIENPLFLKVF